MSALRFRSPFAGQMVGYLDFGLSADSPTLPNGLCAELHFDLEWIDGEICPDEDTATVALTDEDGETVEISPLALPLIREALIERAKVRRDARGRSARSPWEKMIDRACEDNR